MIKQLGFLTWLDAVDVVVVTDEANVVVTGWTDISSFKATFVGDAIKTDVGADDVTLAGATLDVVTELIEDVRSDIVCRTHGSSGMWWLVVTVVVGAGVTAATGVGALTGAAVAGTEFRWWEVGDAWMGMRVWKWTKCWWPIRKGPFNNYFVMMQSLSKCLLCFSTKKNKFADLVVLPESTEYLTNTFIMRNLKLDYGWTSCFLSYITILQEIKYRLALFPNHNDWNIQVFNICIFTWCCNTLVAWMAILMSLRAAATVAGSAEWEDGSPSPPAEEPEVGGVPANKHVCVINIVSWIGKWRNSLIREISRNYTFEYYSNKPFFEQIIVFIFFK